MLRILTPRLHEWEVVNAVKWDWVGGVAYAVCVVVAASIVAVVVPFGAGVPLVALMDAVVVIRVLDVVDEVVVVERVVVTAHKHVDTVVVVRCGVAHKRVVARKTHVDATVVVV